MAAIYFVTGTGTDVGKTVLTRLLVQRLRQRGVMVRAFKPICSGGRTDARALWSAQSRKLALQCINPWWFAAPVAPLIAARDVGRVITQTEVCRHLQRNAPKSGVMLVEGAGGLLSPLGEGFASRELIVALQAHPLLVAVDRLGVLNEARLTWEALPPEAQARAQWVLFAPAIPDASTGTNHAYLAERWGRDRMHRLPRLTPQEIRKPPRSLDALLDALLGGLGLPPVIVEPPGRPDGKAVESRPRA